jgi:hypothetical protein
MSRARTRARTRTTIKTEKKIEASRYACENAPLPRLEIFESGSTITRERFLQSLKQRFEIEIVAIDEGMQIDLSDEHN